MFYASQLFKQKMQSEVVKILDFVEREVVQSYREQGHELTGNLVNTIRKEVEQISNGVIGVLWINEYYKYIDQGVESGRIPYSPGSGAGHSMYIEALTHYFQLRLHLDEKEARGAAFGLAHKQLMQGMPVENGISKYSVTGKRTGFFSQTISENQIRIAEGVRKLYDGAMTEVINYFNHIVSGTITIKL